MQAAAPQLHVEIVPGSRLEELRVAHLITSYEPHLRIEATKRIALLLDRFSASVDTPDAATRLAELRLSLSDLYRKSLGGETRNFATAISILQDMLRPHWSEISREKLTNVSRVVGELREKPRISPKDVERFYGKLVEVLGVELSLGISDFDEQEGQEEAEEREDRSRGD
jgi:hypothetical protein